MSSIETLYRAYAKDVYYYLLGLTRDPAQSEDLLSITFTRAITAWSSFRGESSEKTWLIGIARRAYLEWVRSQKRERRNIAAYFDNQTASDASHLDQIEQLMTVRDERSQQIYRLRLEGYSYQAISQRLGITENSARVIDYRTRQWLKAQISKEVEG